MDVHKKMGQKTEALGTYFNSSQVSYYNHVNRMGRGDAVVPHREVWDKPHRNTQTLTNTERHIQRSFLPLVQTTFLHAPHTNTFKFNRKLLS